MGNETPPPAGDPDRDLVEAAQAGASEAFDRLVVRHQDRVVRLARRITGDAEAALDVAQTVFVKAWRGLSRFHGDSRFSTWLTRIAINTCKNYRRARWNRMVFPGELPPRGAEDKSGDGALIAEVARLPRQQKEVVILHYYREMPVEEIAGALGVSQSAVYARLKRARARLKKRLEGWYFDA